MSKDSSAYCSKCTHKPLCKSPCYPVEHLLDSVTVPLTETPTELSDTIEDCPENRPFVSPESWIRKSNKRKVFELCIIDKRTHQQASIMIGVTRPRVTQIVSEILNLVDNL